MTEEIKPTYIGLWTKEDKNGKPYLNGSDEDLVYFVFQDGNKIPTLFTTPKGDQKSKLKEVGVFEKKATDKVEYMKYKNMCIFPNSKREKETHPHFNLVIYSEEA